MSPRMTTRSAGRATATPQGGRTGGRTGRGGGRTRGRSGDQVTDFSTIIAQQLQDLLPTILAQVGNQANNQGDDRNQNGDAINVNIRGDVRNVIENNDHRGCTFKELLACNPKVYKQKVKYTAGSFVGKALTWWNSQIHTQSRKAVVGMSWEDFKTLMREEFCPSNEMQNLETDSLFSNPKNKRIERYVYGRAPQIRGMAAVTEPTTIQKAVQIASTLTDEAIRNGSIKKNPKKRGNGGEPSKDRNERDDNNRTRTGNAFATTTNPVRRENTGTTPKCTTCNFYHPPEAPCCTCYNCNRPGHLAKDCRVVPRNVNPVNARNPAAARGACFECGGTDHYKSACPSGQLVEIDKVIKGCKLEIDGHVFDINLIPFKSGSFDVIIGERPKEKARHLMSAKAKEQKQEGMVVERDFSPRVFQDD
ncbi:reverse transcriptase domain-containing protein [Tanacetum coccineum]